MMMPFTVEHEGPRDWRKHMFIYLLYVRYDEFRYIEVSVFFFDWGKYLVCDTDFDIWAYIEVPLYI